jgi:hypothetical protein
MSLVSTGPRLVPQTRCVAWMSWRRMLSRNRSSARAGVAPPTSVDVAAVTPVLGVGDELGCG